MAHWVLGPDEPNLNYLLRRRHILRAEMPHWGEMQQFAVGVVSNVLFARRHSPKVGHGASLMSDLLSFEDVHEVVSDMTNSFASWWEGECQAIKESLVKLDNTGTGRIPLREFYGAKADGQWRFGESEDYLRQLGALDESNKNRKQVIIPNYLQGASNCIVTTPHYFICCKNECEPILLDLEEAVGAPVAKPQEILDLLANMSSFETDEAPNIAHALRVQLDSIAATHGGKVPLHGRLFAQWLHYLFPRECPFPHKAGAVSAIPKTEFGDGHMASDEYVSSHASARNSSDDLVSRDQIMSEQEEAQWMSQWSQEEELIADYSLQLQAPWAVSTFSRLGLAFVLFALLVASGALLSGSSTLKPDNSANGIFYSQKAHLV